VESLFSVLEAKRQLIEEAKGKMKEENQTSERTANLPCGEDNISEEK
jgi:hypothetical protein